ncbi:MAG TPA: preprotein translocase YidC, partial [Erysipelotrichaceae bacterium]|nr:preprotein translocase YidC [Erysipelotrichaceae bacterium]
MGFLGQLLGPIMGFCYNLTKNYGLAIILFTLFSKIILLPISVWVQKNSITMVKIEPDVNRIKIKHFGDKDAIAEEQQKLYKKEKYNPLASLVPLIAQIVLLMGVVEVIY